MKLSPEQAAALTHLINVPEFRVYMNMIADMAEESLMVLIKSNENLQAQQGKCRALTEIIEAIESAPGTLEQYQNSK